MADALLPGITNITQRARNYSLIACMYYHAKEVSHLRALESAFIHAYRGHYHGTLLPSVGAVGDRSVPFETNNGVLPLFKDEPIVFVLRADFYGPSARLLGLAGLDALGNHAYESIARRLAESITVSPVKILPPGRESIGPSDADALAFLCLCLPPAEKERELLIEILFRLRERRTSVPGMEEKVDRPRRLSLTLFLLTLEKTADPEAFLLQRFLDWGLNRSGWEPPEALTDHVHGWAVRGCAGTFDTL